MRTTSRSRAAVLASSVLLLSTLAACGLPGGTPPDGCDVEPNDVVGDAGVFVVDASSCNNAGDTNDLDWFVRRVVLGGDLRFTCTTPAGVSPLYDLQLGATIDDPSGEELGEGFCDGTPVELENLEAGFLHVIIVHGGVNNQRADFEVVPVL